MVVLEWMSKTRSKILSMKELRLIRFRFCPLSAWKPRTCASGSVRIRKKFGTSISIRYGITPEPGDLYAEKLRIAQPIIFWVIVDSELSHDWGYILWLTAQHPNSQFSKLAGKCAWTLQPQRLTRRLSPGSFKERMGSYVPWPKSYWFSQIP